MAEHLIEIEEARGSLLACAAYIGEGVKSSEGHSEVMQTVVPQYLAKDEVDIAAELANTVDDPYVRDRLLTAVAEKCAALDDDDYAFQLADAIEDHGMQLQARERIAMQKSAKGDLEKAGEIAVELNHPDYVFADIAIKYFARGDFEKAQGTLDDIGFPAAEVHALHTMAAERIKAEDNTKAVQLLDDALEASAEIEHDEERIRAFSETAHLFIDAKRKDKAVEAYDKARADAEELDNVHRDSFLSSVAYGFFQAGSVELADRTLDLVKNKTQSASCLVGYAREYWTRDEKDQALEALDEAHEILRSEKESETRDSRAKYALFGNMAVQYARFGKAERAIEIAQGILNEGEKWSALSQVAQVLEMEGKDELAHQAINSIDDDVNKMFALIGLSDAAEQSENKERSVAILEEAATMIDSIDQLSSRSNAYNALVARFASHEQVDRAREFALDDLKVIAEIKDDSTRAVSLARLAAVYEEAGLELNDQELAILSSLAKA